MISSLKGAVTKINKDHVIIDLIEPALSLKVPKADVPRHLQTFGQPVTISLKDDGTPLIEPREITKQDPLPGEDQLNVWIDNLGPNG